MSLIIYAHIKTVQILQCLTQISPKYQFNLRDFLCQAWPGSRIHPKWRLEMFNLESYYDQSERRNDSRDMKIQSMRKHILSETQKLLHLIICDISLYGCVSLFITNIF